MNAPRGSPIASNSLWAPYRAIRSRPLLKPNISPRSPPFSGANWDGEELTSGRRPRRPKPVSGRTLTIAQNGMRASVPFFLLKEEIDLLADDVGGLAESRP